jgi:trimeric autotransporter adhesin
MSTSPTLVVTDRDTSFSVDNATFDVLNGASVTLSGSSNTVTLESGAQDSTFNGNNNVISGSDGASLTVSGTGDTITVGNHSGVYVWGGSHTVTVGADSTLQEEDSNSTLYATQGGDRVIAGTSDVVYANNDIVLGSGDSLTVNGDNNQIGSEAWGTTMLSLNGRNNTVGLNNMDVTTSSGSVAVSRDGTIVLTGSIQSSAASLSAGVLSIQLGDGNVATLSNVNSGTQVEYIGASGNTTWSTLLDPSLVHVAGSMYRVTADGVGVSMNNSMFDVLAHSSVNLSGSSNYLILESGADDSYVKGDNNVISGSDGASLTVSGTGDTITVGNHSGVYVWGGSHTVTVGANCDLQEEDSNSTIYATQGGDRVIAGSGDVVNAKNDTVLASGDSLTVNGDNNNIGTDAWGSTTLNVNGSNNSIAGLPGTINLSGNNNVVSFSAQQGEELVTTENGDFVQEDASGAIWFSSASFTIRNGVVTLGFSDGNKVVISDVRSSSLPNSGDTQTSQLVSAMASYSAEALGISSSPAMPMPQDMAGVLTAAH